MGDWLNKLCCKHTLKCHLALKGTSHQHMKQLGWISRELFWVKSQSPKTHIYDPIYISVLKWQNHREQSNGWHGPGMGLREKVGVAIKMLHEVPCGDVTVLCLDCFKIHVLVVILWCSYTGCYHWGKLSKATHISLHYVIQLMSIYN